MDEELIFEVGAEDFDRRVIEASQRNPVLVDFWASWCGPCRMLSPVLEQVIGAHAGEITLAKVNADEQPGLSSTYGVRGLPTVKLFLKGEAVAEFVGARGQAAVEDFIAPYLPNPGADAVAEAEALASKGRGDEALDLLESARGKWPQDAGVVLKLAQLQLQRGRIREARELYAGLPAPVQVDTAGQCLAARLRFAEALNDAPSPGDLLAAAESGDADALYKLGAYAVMAGRYEEAAERLFAIVQRQPAWKEGQARAALLDLIRLLDPASELVGKYRRRLARLLY